MSKIKISKKEEGLPEVAQHGSPTKPVKLILAGLVIAIITGIYFYAKSDIKPQESLEETYTLPSEVPAVVKHEAVSDEKVTPSEVSIPPVSQEVIQQQVAFIQAKQNELQQRLSAPLMLVSATQSGSSEGVPQQPKAVSKDANTQFMQQVSSQNPETTMASTIGPLNSVIAEGSLIHGILESATNSDLPGYLRASVSQPVYSEDGSQVLIPPGSRLIGQYKSGMLQGQSRIFIVWTRLITPGGISINLGSAGVDSLGVAGIGADEIDRHFWERFGTASLLSLIGAGAANVGVDSQDRENSSATYRAAVASSFAQSADQSLQQGSRVAPTLKTYQGKPIIVFVARDLNFQGVMKMGKPKTSVF